MNRRGFFASIAALVAAPTIAKALPISDSGNIYPEFSRERHVRATLPPPLNDGRLYYFADDGIYVIEPGRGAVKL